jgi:hypothetical protein
MSKLAALAAVLALSAAVPTAAAYELPLGVSYDLPDELLAFIAATPSSKDFAVGSGRLFKGQPVDGFNISARGTPLDAQGTVKFRSPSFLEVRGTVTCVFVTGNRAGVSGVLDQPFDGFTHFSVGLEDNGEPSGPMKDRAALVRDTAPIVEADCGLAFAFSGGSLPIEQGNIVVKKRT